MEVTKVPNIQIDNNRCILYYGNRVGYISGETAFVDPMFQTEEMQDFLSRQPYKEEWQQGVYDRLASGIRNYPAGDAPPLKQCRIWQLSTDTPVEMRFISYDLLAQRFGEPDPQNYVAVYDGPVESNDLEAIFVQFNDDVRPAGYTGHALSISDVVELYDESESAFFYCDHVGFQQISFGEQTQGMTMEL